MHKDTTPGQWVPSLRRKRCGNERQFARHLMMAAMVVAGAVAVPATARAQSTDELAKQFSNPIASLVSVPMQLNCDNGIGPTDDGHRLFLNVQPVIPVSIGENWNMISRTIVPIIDQHAVFPGAGSQFGLGDAVQSLFFSPKALTASGWAWGFGPVFLIPTATDDLLGPKRTRVRRHNFDG